MHNLLEILAQVSKFYYINGIHCVVELGGTTAKTKYNWF